MWYKQAFKNPKHTGAMIALFIPPKIGKKIQLNESQVSKKAKIEDYQGFHITLAYLGETKDINVSKNKIIETLNSFAKKHEVIKGKISGIGLFNNVESDGTKALYASFDSPDLPEFRQDLINELQKINGLELILNHGFSPHITLAYVPSNENISEINVPVINIEFNSFILAWAEKHTEFKLQ
jgi:2'-5' RNA ligase